jgi:hypothetical protein
MNTPSFLLSLLLVAVSGAQAQSLPADVGNVSARPLNLSQRSAKAQTDAVLMEPEKSAGQAPDQAATSLPYGAGFETRQLGSSAGGNAADAGRSGASGASGGSGGSGGSGNGGGGRGGSGRGR